jgi:lipopolysaccharide export system protein LptC
MTTISRDVDAPPRVPGEGHRRSRGGSAPIGGAPSPWRGGLAAARRHTILVRVLRGAALAVCLVGIGIVASGALLAPSRLLPGALSAAGVAFDGSKITLESPKISGYQLDRKPYSITARLGVQDIANPHMIELLDIDAGIGTDDDRRMHVLASRARYDSRNELVHLNGDVRITSAGGYDLAMQEARVDFKAGTLMSDSPVDLRLDGATVSGGRMTIDDRRHVISFDGGVKSSIESRPSNDAGASASLSR